MKKFISSILALTFVFSLSTTAFAQTAAYSETATGVMLYSDAVTTEYSRETMPVYISTSGDAVVYAEPDIAYISVGINTVEETSQLASAENAKLTSELIEALEKNGIKSNDIVTQYYSIYPEYNYSYVEPVAESISGYSANHELKITIRNLDKVGEILDLTVNSGATSNYGVSFGVSDRTPYYNQALKEAIKVAVGKADVLAEALGKEKPVVSSIYENDFGYYPYDYSYGSFDKTSTQIKSSLVEIRATVNVSFN